YNRLAQDRTGLINIESSDGWFGSDFRLKVTQAGSSHFVYLETQHLRWLEGVLATAAGQKWKFPLDCFSRSSRRVISLTSFHLKGARVLKIYERCQNGKVFFVIIPMDPHSLGWSSLIKMIQKTLGTTKAGGGFVDGRTYAEIVTRKTLPSEGRCADMLLDGERMIRVEEDGVNERIQFLKTCLLFRFAKTPIINWEEFRTWANRNWGVPEDAYITHVGDDLWLLGCGSEAEVLRIIALGRCRFRDIMIQLDVWIKEAGCSNVCAEMDVAWIVVRGIPLHLRSKKLFRKVGNVCGKFLCSDEGRYLDSVRIKIKMTGPFPGEIPICHDQDVFPLRIDLEAPSLVSASGSKNSFVRKWKNKAKLVEPLTPTSLSPVAPPPTGNVVASCSLELEPISRNEIYRSAEVVGVSEREEEAGEGGDFGTESPGYEKLVRRTFQGGGDTSRGDSEESRALDIATWRGCDWTVGRNFISGPNGRSNTPHKDMSAFGDMLVDGLKIRWASLARPIFCVISQSLPGVESTSATLEEMPLSPLALASVEESLQDRNSEMEDFQSQTNSASLVAAVKEVADLIELEFEGDLGKGKDAAVAICNDVYRRRKSNPLTKTDRELRRLGISADGLASPVSGRRERWHWNIPLSTTLRGGARRELDNLLALLDGLPKECITAGPACVVWPLETSSTFSVRSMRSKMIRESFPGVVDFPATTVWNSIVPTKVQGFLWTEALLAGHLVPPPPAG
ncbi:hypothetical protein LINGRAHAP2_LOCUS8700, partial [Linum grandiflorum]